MKKEYEKPDLKLFAFQTEAIAAPLTPGMGTASSIPDDWE